MARTKERWIAYYAGGTIADGRTIVVPVRLANQPDRLVELRLPASTVERFLTGIVRASETDPVEFIEEQMQADEESSAEEPAEEPEEEPVSVVAPVPTKRLGEFVEAYRRNAGRHAMTR